MTSDDEETAADAVIGHPGKFQEPTRLAREKLESQIWVATPDSDIRTSLDDRLDDLRVDEDHDADRRHEKTQKTDAWSSALTVLAFGVFGYGAGFVISLGWPIDATDRLAVALFGAPG